MVAEGVIALLEVPVLVTVADTEDVLEAEGERVGVPVKGAETVEETEEVPERVWLPDPVCVILPVWVADRVPVEEMVPLLLPEMVGIAVIVPDTEGVGSLEPEADAVVLLDAVDERVTVRVMVLVIVLEGVSRAEPDTLGVIV